MATSPRQAKLSAIKKLLIGVFISANLLLSLSTFAIDSEDDSSEDDPESYFTPCDLPEANVLNTVETDPLQKLVESIDHDLNRALALQTAKADGKKFEKKLHKESKGLRRVSNKIIDCVRNILLSEKSTTSTQTSSEIDPMTEEPVVTKIKKGRGEYVSLAATILQQLEKFSQDKIFDEEVNISDRKLNMEQIKVESKNLTGLLVACNNGLKTLKKIKTSHTISGEEGTDLIGAITSSTNIHNIVKNFLSRKLICESLGFSLKLGAYYGVGAGFGVGICRDSLGYRKLAIVPSYALAKDGHFGVNISLGKEHTVVWKRGDNLVDVKEEKDIAVLLGPNYDISREDKKFQGINIGIAGGKIDVGYYPIRVVTTGIFLPRDHKSVRQSLGMPY